MIFKISLNTQNIYIYTILYPNTLNKTNPSPHAASKPQCLRHSVRSSIVVKSHASLAPLPLSSTRRWALQISKLMHRRSPAYVSKLVPLCKPRYTEGNPCKVYCDVWVWILEGERAWFRLRSIVMFLFWTFMCSFLLFIPKPIV